MIGSDPATPVARRAGARPRADWISHEATVSLILPTAGHLRYHIADIVFPFLFQPVIAPA